MRDLLLALGHRRASLIGHSLGGGVALQTAYQFPESRADVSQATGMLMAQLGIEAAEALVRLRAHAYATGRTATDVARDILDHRLRLEAH